MNIQKTPEYRALKHDCKTLLKKLPETGRASLIKSAYKATKAMFGGSGRNTRLAEFWDAVMTNLGVALKLYNE